MRLYLLRHGNAVPEEVNPQRPLSDEGRAQVQKVASFLRPLNLHVRAIWHSGKLRAQQTAEIVATALAVETGLEAMEGLAPNDPVEPLAERCRSFAGDVFLVGHLPCLARLATFLLVGVSREDLLRFDEASLACLEETGEGWQLLWFLTPHVLS